MQENILDLLINAKSKSDNADVSNAIDACIIGFMKGSTAELIQKLIDIFAELESAQEDAIMKKYFIIYRAALLDALTAVQERSQKNAPENNNS